MNHLCRMKFLFYSLLTLVIFIQCSKSTLTGIVVGVSDGDTFTLLSHTNEKTRVRLHGIDAPEKGQDFGNASKKFLSDLIFQKKVTLDVKNKDRYGRTIAIVRIGTLNVNEELLKAGMAWHYKKYDHSPGWAELEENARKAKRGLWSIPNSVPPWEFRKEKRSTADKSIAE